MTTTTTTNDSKTTTDNLIQFVARLGNASRFISLLAVTEPKMNKKHRETKEKNPYDGKIIKVSQYSFHLNADYQRKVEKAIEKETGEKSEYQVKENYFDHVDLCKSIVVNRKDSNKKYIAGIVLSVKSKYYIDNGNGKFSPINKELLKPYFPPVSKGEFKPEYRTISLDNIVRIKSGKSVWKS